ncbi:hypothetical protein D3C86_1008470 [compost metagenome]
MLHEVGEFDLACVGLGVAADGRRVPDAVDGLLPGGRREVFLVEQDACAHDHDGAALRGRAVRAGASVAGVDLPCRCGVDRLRLAALRGEQQLALGGSPELCAAQVETPQVAVRVAGVGGDDAAGGVPHGDHAAQAAVAASGGVAIFRGEPDEFLELAGERLHHVQPDLFAGFGVVTAACEHDPGAVVQLARGGVVGHVGQVGVVLVLVVHLPEKVVLGRRAAGGTQRRFQAVHERARAPPGAQHHLAPCVLSACRRHAVLVVHVLLDQRAVERVAEAEVRIGQVDLRRHGALGHECGQLDASCVVPGGVQHMDLAVVGGGKDSGRG